MERQGNLMERIAKAVDLADEPIPGAPLLELAGDKRLWVENHLGVTEYSPSRIGIRMKFGTVCVTGCGLQIATMRLGLLLICGRIDSIALLREGS